MDGTKSLKLLVSQMHKKNISVINRANLKKPSGSTVMKRQQASWSGRSDGLTWIWKHISMSAERSPSFTRFNCSFIEEPRLCIINALHNRLDQIWNRAWSCKSSDLNNLLFLKVICLSGICNRKRPSRWQGCPGPARMPCSAHGSFLECANSTWKKGEIGFSETLSTKLRYWIQSLTFCGFGSSIWIFMLL